jgi:hypothetical protein
MKRAGRQGGGMFYLDPISSDELPDLEPPVVYRLGEAAAATKPGLAGVTRAPLGIFNTAWGQVIERLSAVVPDLEHAKAQHAVSGKPPDLTQLLEHHEDVLRSLKEYLDDCYTILKCFFADQKSFKANQDVVQYLAVQKDYYDQVAAIVNEIKHNQARIRPLSLWNERECIPGYFVETAISEGVVGGSPVVHAGRSEGFSLFRDLKMHIVQMYRTAHNLDFALASLTSANRILPAVLDLKSEPKHLDLMRRIRQLPDIVFPDEVDNEFPRIKITKLPANAHVVEMSFQKENDLRSMWKGSIHAGSRGDGVTEGYTFPYVKSLHLASKRGAG